MNCCCPWCCNMVMASYPALQSWNTWSAHTHVAAQAVPSFGNLSYLQLPAYTEHVRQLLAQAEQWNGLLPHTKAPDPVISVYLSVYKARGLIAPLLAQMAGSATPARLLVQTCACPKLAGCRGDAFGGAVSTLSMPTRESRASYMLCAGGGVPQAGQAAADLALPARAPPQRGPAALQGLHMAAGGRPLLPPAARAAALAAQPGPAAAARHSGSQLHCHLQASLLHYCTALHCLTCITRSACSKLAARARPCYWVYRASAALPPADALPC